MYKLRYIISFLFCVNAQTFNCNLNSATDCNSVEKKAVSGELPQLSLGIENSTSIVFNYDIKWRNTKYYDQFSFINISNPTQYLCTNIFIPDSSITLGDEWNYLDETVNTAHCLTNLYITKDINVLEQNCGFNKTLTDDFILYNGIILYERKQCSNNNIFVSKSFEIELAYPLNSNGQLVINSGGTNNQDQDLNNLVIYTDIDIDLYENENSLINYESTLYANDTININVVMNESNILDGLYINNFNMTYSSDIIYNIITSNAVNEYSDGYALSYTNTTSISIRNNSYEENFNIKIAPCPYNQDSCDVLLSTDVNLYRTQTNRRLSGIAQNNMGNIRYKMIKVYNNKPYIDISLNSNLNIPDKTHNDYTSIQMILLYILSTLLLILFTILYRNYKRAKKINNVNIEEVKVVEIDKRQDDNIEKEIQDKKEIK
jgi:hypothetical protein